MLLSLLPVAVAALPLPMEVVDAAEGRLLARSREAGAHAQVAPAPPSAEDEAFDVEHVVLRVRIAPGERQVAGHATLQVRRLGPGDLVLHADGPRVSFVDVDGERVPVTTSRDELHVPVSGDRATVDVQWTWGGASDPSGGLQWGEVTYSFHEPIAARKWLVLHDVPWDKFTLQWQVEAPADQVVAANGVLASAEPAGEGFTRWTYDFDAPIASYLVAVHVAPYVRLEDLRGEVPIYAWVLPGMEADAEETFGTTPDMIPFFAERFGPYLWPSYGNAVAPFGGAMEHTTVTTFSSDLVGDPFGELVNAHELAHHWFGDDVTLQDWPDIWLNEGFASYAEALWYERSYGQEGLSAYAAYYVDSYRRWNGYEGIFPLYDPDYLWGGTVYDKGAMVVHMLRHIVGDTTFFEILRTWEATHRFGNASTRDFTTLAGEVAGEDLTWFFEPWLYAAGEPTWEEGWATREVPGGWALDLRVAQDRQEFRLPAPVRVTLEDGSILERAVWVEGAGVEESWCVASRPVDVEVDPDVWLLVDHTRGGGPLRTDNPCDGGEDTAVVDSGAPDGGDSGAGETADTEGLAVSGGCGCAVVHDEVSWGGGGNPLRNASPFLAAALSCGLLRRRRASPRLP
jgi:aminopeptidase N